jgi:hypothetical protein
MSTRNGWVVLASIIALISAVNVCAQEPFAVAERATKELYIKPLGLTGAKLKIETEPFAVGCPPTAITVRVLLPAKGGEREVLKVDMFVLDDRLEFVGARGPALRNVFQPHSNDAIAQTIAFLARTNGWTAIDEPARRGAKKGYIERRMRKSQIRAEYELDIATIVFDQSVGVPLLIGAPPAPTAAECGDTGRPVGQ